MPTTPPVPFPVAAVTGAASGIGHALCRQLVTEGSTVFASDVDADGLAALVEAARGSGSLHTAVVDVADAAAVDAWAADVVGRGGPPDLVVNNAGIALSGRVWEMSRADIAAVHDVNFWGVVHGTLAFLPDLRRRGTGQIVNVSSIFGMIGFPATSAYNSSKFAVRGFTECLQLELDMEGSGVGVSCVHPGGVSTSIVEHQRTASRRATPPDRQAMAAEFERRARTTPEQAARIILRGARRRRRRILVGWDARIMDACQRLLGSWYQPLVRALASRSAELL